MIILPRHWARLGKSCRATRSRKEKLQMADIDLDLTEAELFLFQTTQFMFKDLITMWKNLQMRVYYKFLTMILLLHTNG